MLIAFRPQKRGEDMRNTAPLAPEAAEKVGLEALTWIAGDAERAGTFLAASGAAPGDLRARIKDPAFLGFVIDFLLADEDALIAFSTETGTPPDLPMRARAALPGGDLPNWT